MGPFTDLVMNLEFLMSAFSLSLVSPLVFVWVSGAHKVSSARCLSGKWNQETLGEGRNMREEEQEIKKG